MMSDNHSTSEQSHGIGLKFLVIVAAILVILASFYASRAILSPFLLAVFLAMILMPPLQWLKKKGLSSGMAIFAISGIVAVLGMMMVFLVSSSLSSFAQRLPEYRQKMSQHLTMLDDWIRPIVEKMDSVEEAIPRFSLPENVPNTNESDEAWTQTELAEADQNTDTHDQQAARFSVKNIIPVDSLVKYAQWAIAETMMVMTTGFLVAILVIFMLIEGARIPEKLREAFPDRDFANAYLDKIALDTWNYIKIKTIVSALTGVVAAIGLWFLGVEYALLWGLLLFVLNYIPNIGQVIAAVPPILLALVDQGVTMGLIVSVWLVIVNTAFGYGVEPRYLGEGLGISGLIVLLSLIFWGWLLGPIGMFLSAPLTMVVKIVLQNDSKTRWVAIMLKN